MDDYEKQYQYCMTCKYVHVLKEDDWYCGSGEMKERTENAEN